MISEFGKFVRVYRMNHGEYLKNMADKLGVTSSFLSSVETGKQKVPANWFEKLCNVYDFTDSEKDDLMDSINMSNNAVNIDLSTMDSTRKDLTLSFARKVNTLSPEDIEAMKRHLNGGN